MCTCVHKFATSRNIVSRVVLFVYFTICNTFPLSRTISLFIDYYIYSSNLIKLFFYDENTFFIQKLSLDTINHLESELKLKLKRMMQLQHFWWRVTYLLMWHYNQYLVKACPRRSFHDWWRVGLSELKIIYLCTYTITKHVIDQKTISVLFNIVQFRI
jgi:hypothetical protein